MSGLVAPLLASMRAEFQDLTLRGPAARLSLATGLGVGLAVVLALALRLDQPYWAGISAFVSSQPTRAMLLDKTFHRVVGTALGAGVSLLMYCFGGFDTASILLLLFAAGTLAVLGNLVSAHPYPWLLGGLTTVIIVLGAIDDPSRALSIAAMRFAAIVVGCLAALLMANLLPAGEAVLPAAPGWRSLLGPNWYMLNHGLRTGLAVALVPVVWRVLELPDLSQMAISVAAAMGVPALTGEPQRDARLVAERMAQRVAGCLLGGGAALLVLTLPASALLVPWLLLLMAGTAVAAQIQFGRHKIATVGAQGAFAVIITLVQGPQPAELLSPAVSRLAGILGALALLALVGLVFGPGPARPQHL
jgi:uncharacterized membrane protein YccC